MVNMENMDNSDNANYEENIENMDNSDNVNKEKNMENMYNLDNVSNKENKENRENISYNDNLNSINNVYNLNNPDKPERLDRVVSFITGMSRNEVKKYIKHGYITINGRTAVNHGIKVFPGTDIIKVENTILKYKKYIYLMLNKPAGYITAVNDNKIRTVQELLPEKYRKTGVYPAGRLDKDTEGFLLMTNDGELVHCLLSPKRHISKEYYVKVNGLLDENDIEAFRKGMVLDGNENTMPAVLDILSFGIGCSEAKVIIYEGKYHQIKRMFAARGKQVLYLKRTAIGNVPLDERLEKGSFRELTSKEEYSLLKAAYPERTE